MANTKKTTKEILEEVSELYIGIAEIGGNILGSGSQIEQILQDETMTDEEKLDEISDIFDTLEEDFADGTYLADKVNELNNQILDSEDE